jgi:hypothetical protein
MAPTPPSRARARSSARADSSAPSPLLARSPPEDRSCPLEFRELPPCRISNVRGTYYLLLRRSVPGPVGNLLGIETRGNMLRRTEDLLARIRTEVGRMPGAKPPKMLSADEAAKDLGVTPRRLDTLARAALISSSFLGGERTFLASEVERYRTGGPRI